MALNMALSIAVFVLNLCVSFFLTPYIVQKLGAAAYGFIGLSNNIIGYTSLLTIAINSMAGRFITISVHQKSIEEANLYLSTVFFTNLLFAIIFVVTYIVLAIFLPNILSIPDGQISDVQTLFILLGLSSSFGLMTGIFGVSTYITNRLDLSNIRTMVGMLIRVVLLLLMYGLFAPKLWFFGIAAMMMCFYTMATNFKLMRVLTPQLHISRANFNWSYLKEVTASGAWNILTKLSEILSRGLDLLLANIFISATAMGLLSITMTIPILIISFFSSISANFAPVYTKLYAEGKLSEFNKELKSAIRLCGFLSCLPMAIVFVYGEMFYSLWLPGQNANLLYWLTIAGCAASILSMPLEPLWSIFTITNKVKLSSLNLLLMSVLTIITVLVLMYFSDNEVIRLFILASTRTFYGIIRVLTFLPIYGAKILGFSKWNFYPSILKNLINISVLVSFNFVIKNFLLENSWFHLFIGCLITLASGIAISSVTILTSPERVKLATMIKQKLHIS